MMTSRTIKALALCLLAMAAQPGLARDCRLTVYFGLDRDDLSPDMQYVLATFLANNPHAHGTVIGHTDALASQEYNMDLSRRRAMTVINFIEQFKSNSVRLATDWQGKLNLAVNTPNAEPLNRRVEIYYHNCAPAGPMPAVLRDYVSEPAHNNHAQSGSSSSAHAGSGQATTSQSGNGSAAAATAGNGQASTSASGQGWAASASAGPNGASAASSGSQGASAATAGNGTTSVSSTSTGD